MKDYLSVGSDRLVVNPTRVLIIDYDTSDILKGVSGPTWVRHTYSSEGGPFSSIISCLCAYFPFVYFSVLFDC
jgi:predicted Ser/Thr protein kinase